MDRLDSSFDRYFPVFPMILSCEGFFPKGLPLISRSLWNSFPNAKEFSSPWSPAWFYVKELAKNCGWQKVETDEGYVRMFMGS